MKLLNLSAALLLSLCTTAIHAATIVWTPTDGNVNYSYSTDAGYSLALFDVEDFDSALAEPLVLSPAFDTISIIASGAGNYTATGFSGDSITLYGDNEFVVAITDGTSWYEPVSYTENIAGSIYTINFANGSALSIDAVPTIIPVPAAVWLFGTGLIGMVAVARRRV